MRKTAAYAFHHSIPILIGFFPVGIAYGLLMQQAGYNFLWSGACSLFVLAGSLQFLMVTFFAGGVSLATVAVLALLLNSRHIFYGLSFIDKFRSFGPWRWFLIYSLCDENYSLHCSHDFGPDVNEKWAYVLTAAFVTFYWVALSMLGGLVGSLIPFDTTGIDFALTALFTVIVVDQLRGARTRIPAVVAAVSSIGALLLLGPDRFLLPSLLVTVAALTLLRPVLEPKYAEGGAAVCPSPSDRASPSLQSAPRARFWSAGCRGCCSAAAPCRRSWSTSAKFCPWPSWSRCWSTVCAGCSSAPPGRGCRRSSPSA